MLKLKLFLTLPRIDDTLCLDICFLARGCSSGGNTLTVGYRAYGLIAPLLGVRVWIEVIARPRERRQNTLLWIICFK